MSSNDNLRVKLLYPPGEWNCWWRGLLPFPYLPYGMGILVSALRENGYYVEQDDLLFSLLFRKKRWRVNPSILAEKNYINRFLKRGILDQKFNRLAEDILEDISYSGFDIIGFSILSYSQFRFALLLAEKIKKNTGSLIVFGGAFITLQGQDFFSKYNFIDFMIVGDGERPFTKLLNFLQGIGRIEQIPGLLYRDNNDNVKINPRESYNIEDMPLPDFDGLPLELYKIAANRLLRDIILPYQISRGCAHRCSFCAQPGFHKISIKSFDKVIKELKEYKERYKSNFFDFCDWSINISYQHMDQLCDLFLREKLHIYWSAWARVDYLDNKLLKKMKLAGCERLFFGIESGSNNILQLMRKDVSAEQASRILKLSYEMGIKAYITLIVGFPHETKLDVDKTIKFIEENSIYIFDIVSVNPFLLEYYSPMHSNPEEFKIENLRIEYGVLHRNYFAFDESDGLKWRQKEKQQKCAYRRVLKAIYYNIFSKNFSTRFIPFWAWRIYKILKGISYSKHL